MSAVENLVEAGLVEGVGSGSSRSYMLSARVYKRSEGLASYVRQRDIDATRRSGLVLEFAEKNDGVVTTADVMDLFGLSYISAYRVLKKLEDAGKLRREGNGPVSYTHLDVYKRQAVDGASVPTSLVVGEPLSVTLPDGTELPTYGSLDDSGRATFDVAGVLPLARPTVRICVPAEGDGKAGKDGNGSLVFTGLAFHGVPSGHEFNSFCLLYTSRWPSHWPLHQGPAQQTQVS